jgi:spermidine/putrescine transport system substrate-binding protein
MHPKDRGVTRGRFLRGAGSLAAGAGAGGLLAAGENTTQPVGSAPTGATSPLVVPKPLGPGGLPLPRTDNSVTWAILDDNQAVADGKEPEGGSLRVYNYADYLDPDTLKKFETEFNCQVEIATYNSADEAYSKLASGSVSFDVILGLSGGHIVQLMAGQILQPLNHSYLPNLANIWPELQDPFYDKGSRYTVPYVVWCDGIGWRNDVVKEEIAGADVPWDIFWHSEAYKGKVGLLDDYRDGLSMPMQREGLRQGRIPDLNTEDATIIQAAGAALEELSQIANIKVAITDYQTLPEGKTVLHHSWSGDLVSAALYYLPEGTPADVLSFWGPTKGGVVQNDFFCIQRGATKPVLAHAWINFMLDPQNAYDNFANFVGYVPPQTSIDAKKLVTDELIPESLEPAIVTPEQFLANQELLSLSVEGDRLWQNAWSKFRAG